MRRFPQFAFAGLVAATVAAFFITQHLKTTTPLLASPRISPDAINPNGGPCRIGQHTVAGFSFYALNHAERADVAVIDSAGRVVREIARHRRLRVGVRTPDGQFSWNGRTASGALAPDGRYTIQVKLEDVPRPITISSPAGVRYITVITSRPTAAVTGVSPARVTQGAPPVHVSIAQSGVAAPRFDGGLGRGTAYVDIFALDRAGQPHLAVRYRVMRLATETTWNLRIRRHAAPPGRYLIGMDVLDPACNAARFPGTLPSRVGPRETLPPQLSRAIVTVTR